MPKGLGSWGVVASYQLGGFIGCALGLTGILLGGWVPLVGVGVAIVTGAVLGWGISSLDAAAHDFGNAITEAGTSKTQEKTTSTTYKAARAGTSFMKTTAGKVVTGTAVVALATSVVLSGGDNVSVTQPTSQEADVSVTLISTPTYTPSPVSSENLVKIPNVIGLTPDKAESKLKEARFGVLPGKDGYSDDVPAGHIYKQEPAAGELYDPKSTVVMIYRSLGPASTVSASAPTAAPVPPTPTPVGVGPNEIWLIGKYDKTSEYCEGDACAKGTVLKGVSKFVAGSSVPISGAPGKVFVIEELGGRCQVGPCVGQPLGVFSTDYEVEVRGLVIMLDGKEVAGWREALGGDCRLPDTAQGSNLYMTICPSSDYYSKPYK